MVVTRPEIEAIVEEAIERAADAIAKVLPDTPREGQRHVALLAIVAYLHVVREREATFGPLPRIAV